MRSLRDLIDRSALFVVSGRGQALHEILTRFPFTQKRLRMRAIWVSVIRVFVHQAHMRRQAMSKTLIKRKVDLLDYVFQAVSAEGSKMAERALAADTLNRARHGGAGVSSKSLSGDGMHEKVQQLEAIFAHRFCQLDNKMDRLASMVEQTATAIVDLKSTLELERQQDGSHERERPRRRGTCYRQAHSPFPRSQVVCNEHPGASEGTDARAEFV